MSFSIFETKERSRISYNHQCCPTKFTNAIFFKDFETKPNIRAFMLDYSSIINFPCTSVMCSLVKEK